MKLAFMQVYNEANWVGFAIEQAMCLCDKLLIVEGSQFTAFPDIPERSNDGTLDIINDKVKEHRGRILLSNTIRKYENYRQNQCANFNRGLEYCNKGDYFIKLDADEFYLDEWIAEANELMSEGKIDLIKALSYELAFSFKWNLDYDKTSLCPLVAKKTDKFHFVPTHKYKNPGKNIITISQIGRFHYGWVKPRERILTRMRTSGAYTGMVKWFETVWCNMKLEADKTYQGYNGSFTLRRYNGIHPSVLADHPWRNMEDIRRLEI